MYGDVRMNYGIYGIIILEAFLKSSTNHGISKVVNSSMVVNWFLCITIFALSIVPIKVVRIYILLHSRPVL